MISRIYAPDAVGEFAVVLAAGQVAAIVSTWRVEQVLPRAATDRRWQVVRTVLVLTLGVLAPVANTAAWLVNGGGLVDWLASLVLVVSLALFNLMTYVGFGQKAFADVARSRVANGFVTAAAQVLVGLVHPTAVALIVTYAIGNLAGCVFQLRQARAMRRERGPEGLRDTVRHEGLRGFGATVGTTALLSNLSLGLPLLLHSPGCTARRWSARSSSPDGCSCSRPS